MTAIKKVVHKNEKAVHKEVAFFDPYVCTKDSYHLSMLLPFLNTRVVYILRVLGDSDSKKYRVAPHMFERVVSMVSVSSTNSFQFWMPPPTYTPSSYI